MQQVLLYKLPPQDAPMAGFPGQPERWEVVELTHTPLQPDPGVEAEQPTLLKPQDAIKAGLEHPPPAGTRVYVLDLDDLDAFDVGLSVRKAS